MGDVYSFELTVERWAEMYVRPLDMRLQFTVEQIGQLKLSSLFSETDYGFRLGTVFGHESETLNTNEFAIHAVDVNVIAEQLDQHRWPRTWVFAAFCALDHDVADTIVQLCSEDFEQLDSMLGCVR